jgi:hypothetical protein
LGHGKTIGLLILNGVVDYFLVIFFDEFTKYLFNITPIDELKATLGLIFLVGATVSGVLLIQHLLNIRKRRVTGIDNKGYKSKLDPKLRDIDDFKYDS